ncbi:L-ascorbate oxidase-like protein [Hibiscus syriacus]|uniref:L-ascorbate oxidase-like protein n=1 Tax=Hibiscus syriacus TaxID=106335 RepID=A0A6A2Y1J4_HIBSY|nr:L-ascorbate oxidase-like protein [Hibiscus syriacus]
MYIQGIVHVLNGVGTLYFHKFHGVYVFTWNVTYGTISPLGFAQQLILINGEFPGLDINSTTNNMFSSMSGIQQRKNSWEDGVPGTNCPIALGTNFTYKFQVKDQIGNYVYYPSMGMHRETGAFGGLRIHSRVLIPVHYDEPANDYTVLIGDWYTKSHKELWGFLDSGRPLGRPDGVLINGKSGKVGAKQEPLFTMEPGKKYKYMVCNVGLKASLNFRIQGHTMKLVEMEGSHTVQNVYDSLDVHIEVQTGTAIISYTNSKGEASPELPPAPVGWAWSLNQFRTFRWNLTASAARPNPQVSYHYGAINITRTIRLVNNVSRANGKLRYDFNDVSHTDPTTPLKLTEYFNVENKVFKYNMIKDEPENTTDLSEQPNVLNMTFRNFVELIFENHEKNIQSYHIDGYSFFAVAVEPGTWSPEKRMDYKLLDAVSRHIIHVFPKSWETILLTYVRQRGHVEYQVGEMGEDVGSTALRQRSIPRKITEG